MSRFDSLWFIFIHSNSMNTITPRLPDALQARLQSVAVINHRSIDKQDSVLLEQALRATPPTINTEA